MSNPTVFFFCSLFFLTVPMNQRQREGEREENEERITLTGPLIGQRVGALQGQAIRKRADNDKTAAAFHFGEG